MAVTNLWVGGVTTDSAEVVAKLTTGTNATLKVSTASDLSSPVDGSTVAINGNGLAKLTITGLTAGTQYYYGIDTDGTLDTVTTGAFRTAPSGQASFSFAFGSCNTTGDSSDAFTRALARDPDLCLITGDLHYEDPGSSSDFYTGFDSNLGTAMGEMLANVPTAYTWSDHDWSSDNNGGASSAMNSTANSIYRERVPSYTLEESTTGIHHTFTWGRVRFIVCDERSFKSSNSATDNSSKTVLGSTQKQWLKDTITAATEPVIFWVGDTPWNGSASSPDDEWFAYDTERQELATFFAASGKNIIRLCGDMHALAADDGTNSPGGIPILHAAPWFNLFSNKAGPYTDGPYPTSGSSDIEQYGYVTVTDNGSTVTVDFAGYDSSDVERVSWTDTYDAVPEPPAMPTGDLPGDSYSAGGWSQVMADDFATDCTEGNFLTAYPTWFAYPDTWTNSPATSTYNGGNSIRVEGGIAKIRYFHDGSVARTEALEPPNTGDMTYGVYEVCFRLPQALPDYKMAFLLWPESDVWGDGEIDYPETDWDSTDTIGGFVHEVGATPENNAYSFDTGELVVGNDWHTARTVWADDHLDFYLDGVLVGSYTSTTHVPDNPHRWVLQTEAGSNVPGTGVTGDLEIAYVVAWNMTRRTSEWSAPDSDTTLTATQQGSASGAVAWVGVATGTMAPEGAVTGAVSFSGTATGVMAPQGSVSGSVSFVGTAEGAAALEGSAAGAVTWVGTATGEAPLVGVNTGSAGGSVVWAGSATGTADLQGSASGSVVWVGQATGQTPGQSGGSAAGSVTWVGVATGYTIPLGSASGAVSWVGEVEDNTTHWTFSPPTHEEPIRTTVAPLKYYRLTYANSIVRVNGVFTSVRTPHAALLEGLTEGEDYFKGGYIYDITQQVANELIAAGFSPVQN